MQSDRINNFNDKNVAAVAIGRAVAFANAIEPLESRRMFALAAASPGVGLLGTYANESITFVSGVPTISKGSHVTDFDHTWRFDGDATDSSGTSDATLAGSPSYTASGKINNALTLNGTSQYANTGTWDLGTNFTISAWVKLNSTATSIQTVLANKLGGTNAGYAFYVNTWNTSDRKLTLETVNSAGVQKFTTTDAGAVPLNTWTQVAVTVKNGNARLYVNGVDKTSTSSTTDVAPGFTTSATNYIGAFAGPAFYFNGSIDQVAYKSSALSAPDMAQVYASPSGMAPIEVRRIDPTVNMTWASGAAPATGISTPTYGVTWTGQIRADATGTYSFQTVSNDGVRLTIDDGNATGATPLINNWNQHTTSATDSGSMLLITGHYYNVTLEYYNASGGGTMQLKWQKPGDTGYSVIPTANLYPPQSVSGVGLTASYYNNTTLSGTPAITRVDPLVAFTYTGGDTPDPAINPNAFSAVWEGEVEAIESGTYTFRTYSDDGVRLKIAELGSAYPATNYIDDWTLHGNTADDGAPITLQAGRRYKIRMEYFNGAGDSTAQLYWTRPGGSPQPIPTSQLYPNQEMISNSSFDGNYVGGTAPGWTYSPSGVKSFTSTTTAANVHSGTMAQAITVASAGFSTGGVMLGQGVAITPGHTYAGTLWARTDTPGGMDVSAIFRQNGGTYTDGAVTETTVGSTWQKITVRGGYTDFSNIVFGISIHTPGTLYLDDASLVDITPAVQNYLPANTSAAVPTSFMGQHFNRGGYTDAIRASIQNTTKLGMIRFWDTGTTWNDFESGGDGVWNTGLIAGLQSQIASWKAANPNMQFIMTLGITPTWAASDPTATSPYGGSSSPPADIAKWKAYVSKMVASFPDIHYYEVWNEADNQATPFYSGTAASLVPLAKATAEVLHAAGSQYKVLSPSFTLAQGLLNFLQAGGGQYVDVINMHGYVQNLVNPENQLAEFQSERAIIDAYGQNAKPFWNDEGGYGYMQSGDTTFSNDEGQLARYYLVNWLAGASNQDWYTWDLPQHLRLSDPNGTNDTSLVDGTQWANATNYGKVFGRINGWLTGAVTRLTKASQDGTWVVDLDMPGGITGHIVWNTNTSATYTLPWTVNTMYTLDSDSATAFSGTTITATGKPVILENVPGGTPAHLAAKSAVGDGTAQRSSISGVSLAFTNPVTLTSNALSLETDSGGIVPGVTLALTPTGKDGKTYNIQFGGRGVVGNSLSNGRYKLVVKANAFSDTYGQTLASDFVMPFFRLYGDLDGNGTTNNSDYFWFKRAMNQSAGMSGYMASLDYDNNGVINNSDYYYFKQNYDRSI